MVFTIIVLLVLVYLALATSITHPYQQRIIEASCPPLAPGQRGKSSEARAQWAPGERKLCRSQAKAPFASRDCL